MQISKITGTGKQTIEALKYALESGGSGGGDSDVINQLVEDVETLQSDLVNAEGDIAINTTNISHLNEDFVALDGRVEALEGSGGSGGGETPVYSNTTPNTTSTLRFTEDGNNWTNFPKTTEFYFNPVKVNPEEGAASMGIRYKKNNSGATAFALVDIPQTYQNLYFGCHFIKKGNLLDIEVFLTDGVKGPVVSYNKTSNLLNIDLQDLQFLSSAGTVTTNEAVTCYYKK